MNTRSPIILLIALAAIALTITPAHTQTPDTVWTKTYGGSNDDRCTSILQTSEGGYILGGNTNSSGTGAINMYLVKIDPNGVQEWETTFDAIDDREKICSSVLQTTDGGYLLAGYTSDSTAGGYDMYVVKTDSEGTEEWEAYFGDENDQYCFSAQQTTDGGYILGGSDWPDRRQSDMYLVKIDALGGLQWESNIGDTIWRADECYSVQQTSDEGYILGGYTYTIQDPLPDMYLVKTDSQGIQEWEQTYGGSAFDQCKSVRQTNEGGYILCGGTESYGHGDSDIWVVKTDPLGNLVWERTFGGMYYETGESIASTFDGAWIVCGNANSFGAGGMDM